MSRWQWTRCLPALVLLACLSAPALADRVPMRRAEGMRSHGTRPDISVPYLTTGRSAFGAYSVSPLIYAAPTVDNPYAPGARPVYNLPFYGARMGFSGYANGAVPKTYLLPSRNR
jgi:hypothetical protein